MPKLTDTQLIVLSKAAAREDGAAIVPEKLNRSAASKLSTSLMERQLMREIQSKPGMPVWRRDDEEREVSLIITRHGRTAIGVDDNSVENETAKFVVAEPVGKTHAAAEVNPVVAKPAAATAAGAPPRSGSKQALVIELLSGPGGTTLDALVAATGWLPHTTRAALTGLRKRGMAIERERPEGAKVSIYRIAANSSMAA